MVNLQPRSLALLLVIAFSMVCVSALAGPSEQQKLRAVQALFLYNFANFAEWPKEAFEDKTQALRMCLYGDVEFEQQLRNFDGTHIGVRPLEIFKSSKIEEVQQGCHMLFISKKQHAKFPDFWNQVSTWYLLRVGEQDDFNDEGGIINILQTTAENETLELEINLYNAMESGLLLSPDLISLAREIKRVKD